MATFLIRPIGENFKTGATRYKTPDLQASQTFEAGAPVVLGAGGIAEAGTNPALIFGFATASAESYDFLADTHGFVTPSVPVALADGEFRGTLKGTFAAADVGAEYGLTKDGSSGVWYVDKAKTATNARVYITGVDQLATDNTGSLVEVTAGDIDVPVTFIVSPDHRQVG